MCLDYNFFDDESQIAQLRIKTDFCVELPLRLGMFLDNAFGFSRYSCRALARLSLPRLPAALARMLETKKARINIH